MSANPRLDKLSEKLDKALSSPKELLGTGTKLGKLEESVSQLSKGLPGPVKQEPDRSPLPRVPPGSQSGLFPEAGSLGKKLDSLNKPQSAPLKPFFQPKGTDKVPAMLTEGEFVSNKGASQKHQSQLEKWNREEGEGGSLPTPSLPHAYAGGGPVYLAKGGPTSFGEAWHGAGRHAPLHERLFAGGEWLREEGRTRGGPQGKKQEFLGAGLQATGEAVEGTQSGSFRKFGMGLARGGARLAQAGEAMGGGLGGAASVLGTIAGAAGGVIAFGAALVEGVQKLQQWDRAVLESAFKMAEASPSMNVVQSMQEMRDFILNMQKGEAQAPAINQLAESMSRMNQALAPFENAFIVFKAELLTALSNVVKGVAELLKPLLKLAGQEMPKDESDPFEGFGASHIYKMGEMAEQYPRPPRLKP